MSELAYVNGNILPLEKAVVSIEDRGYQFGDAVYEYIASYNGKPFYLEAHLERLQRSMKALSFPTISNNIIRAAILELFQRSLLERAGVYIQISRGVAPRNHAFPESSALQVIMTVRKVREVPEKLKQNGAKAITMKDFRWGRCDIKTVQLLPNVIAKQKAIEAGVYDTIFVSEDGVVREATSSNVFIVRQGNIITHPLTSEILAGITRMVIIAICNELNLPVKEQHYKVNELYSADEVFLTGTTTEVLSLIKIDNQSIGSGDVGPVSKRLLEALQDMGNR